MNGGTTVGKTGAGATRTGRRHPSPLHTAALSFRLIFFSERALYAVFLNNAHMFNLVCMFIVSLFIPYIGMDGKISPENTGNILEGLVLTMFFYGGLFLYMPKTVPVFLGFIRVMMALEIMAVFLPLTFLVPSEYVKYFHPLYFAWYLSLVTLAYSRIRGYGYFRSGIIVLAVFMFISLIPALFA